MSTESQQSGDHLSVRTKLAFGLGNLSIMVGKQAPKQLSLPIYNVALGVNPAWVGTVLALGRLWDAFIDPSIGHWSDQTASRWGRRRPFILLGAIFSGLFFAGIWLFPRGLSSTQYIAYYMVMSLLFYLALAVFSVPWYALGYELATEYNERTRLMAVSSVIGPVGQILVAWLYPLTQRRGLFVDTIEGIRWVGIGAGIVIVIFGMIPALFIRERIITPSAGQLRARPKKPTFIEGIKAASKNNPFIRLTIAFSLTLIGTSMIGGLGFYVHVYYLYGGDTKLGGDLTAQHTTIGLICNILFTPLIVKLSNRFGKKEIFMAALIWGFLRMFGLWFMLSPAHPKLVLINGVLMGLDNAAIFMLCHSMIADVCDVDERDTGHRREGLFGALYAWVFKTGIALSYAVSSYILVWIGFDRKLGGAQSATTLLWMKGCYCAVPALFFFLAIVVFRRYPINRRFATEVRAELDARHRRAEEAPA